MKRKSDLFAHQDHKRPVWITASIIAIITVVVYLPALQNGFVNWDDQLYVSENQNIRYISIGFFKWDITAIVASLWHPLTMFSFALDYSIWGLDPLGYHLSNILFHAANTFLVFILVIRLFECAVNSSSFSLHSSALIAASVTALLFGIHPLHVESVAWISERKDVLCAFFFLLSILSYLRYNSSTSSKKRLFYAASLIFFILSLMSKPMAVSLPLVLIILDFYPLRRLTVISKATLIEKLPFFVIGVLAALLTIWTSPKVLLENLPLTIRVITAINAWEFYLFKIVLPFSLAPFYPYSVRINFFAVKFAILLIAAFFYLLFSKKGRLFFTGCLYYTVTLMPVLGIVQVGSQAAADRYTYLPSLAPFMLLGVGIGYLLERHSKKRQIAMATALVFMFAGLTYKTQTQISVWKDSVTLWSHEIKLFYNVEIAYNNRGKALDSLGNYQQAIEDFSKAIEIRPLSAIAYTNRGNSYNSLGNYQQAIEDFSKAIEINPRYALAYYNRGNVYAKLGNYQQAIINYDASIKYSQFTLAYNNRGNAYRMLGKYQNAIEDYNMAIKLSPSDGIVYENRGVAYRNLGDNEQAMKDFEVAKKLNFFKQPDYSLSPHP